MLARFQELKEYIRFNSPFCHYFHARYCSALYLYHQSDFFDASDRVPVKRIKGVVPHDWWLKDIAASPVQHEQSLVHLHRLVCG